MGTVVFHLGHCSPHNSGAYYGCYSFGPRQLRLRCICAATDSRTDICAPIRYCVSLRCNKRCNILSDVASPGPANPVPKSIRVYLRSPVLWFLNINSFFLHCYECTFTSCDKSTTMRSSHRRFKVSTACRDLISWTIIMRIGSVIRSEHNSLSHSIWLYFSSTASHYERIIIANIILSEDISRTTNADAIKKCNNIYHSYSWTHKRNASV